MMKVGFLVLGLSIGAYTGYMAHENRPVEGAVMRVADYLCKSNEGVEKVQAHRHVERYSIYCYNGAVFPNQHILLESHYPKVEKKPEDTPYSTD